MATSVRSILDAVARLLDDPDFIKNTEEEMLSYLSEGQRAIVLLRPESNPETAEMPLEAGSKQTLPTDAYQLLEAIRNVGGAAVAPTSRADLDQADPGWHTSNPNPMVEQTVYDVRARKTLLVQPPQPTPAPNPANKLEIVYAKIPENIGFNNAGVIAPADIELDDIYTPALRYYMLHMAYIKEANVKKESAAKSSSYFEWFKQLILGTAEQKDVELTIRQEAAETLSPSKPHGVGAVSVARP